MERKISHSINSTYAKSACGKQDHIIETANISKLPNIEVINCGIQQGCPLLPSLFNLYIDEAV